MFRNRTAVITGGANGIGRCIAEEFRRNGADVYIIDKVPGEHYVGDIAKKEVLEEFARYVIDRAGHVDFLVNNALPLMKGIDECSYEEFRYALDVGVTAPFWLSRLLAPYMPEGSSIINISSSRDRMSQPQTENYTAAKGGIAALTHAMAVSFAGRIRVNSVSPGMVAGTAWYRNREGFDVDAHNARQALEIPIGRVATGDDVADTICFLISDKGAYLTGVNIPIDGGRGERMP
ncbi:MAG: SDR family oxidoreductase [Solobacterium sp.]|nr:SDR family oxidoreductase [Solobacterium sp.]